MRSAITLVIVFLTIKSTTLFAQDSTKSSIGLTFRPAIPLPKFETSLEISHPEQIAQKPWIPEIDMRNPFAIDTRTSSYYVPRQVRDELNLIMNRPRESAFMPVLGIAAFLAYQIAENVLLINMKTSIEAENLAQARNKTVILEHLWNKNPQTADDLYSSPEFSKDITLSSLIDSINILTDNKLIRSRRDVSEIYYYPALSRDTFLEKINSALSDSNTDPGIRDYLEELLNKLNSYVR